MRLILFAMTLLPMMMGAGVVSAEPPVPNSVASPSTQSSQPIIEEVIRAKVATVKRGLSMVFYKNEKDGAEAFVTVEPDFNPGCKLQLTLLF